MSSYKQILSVLNQSVNSNSARLKTFAALIVGVIHFRSVNLSKIAAFRNSQASEDSQYRKLQRFFKEWLFPWKDIARIVISRIPRPKQGYVLSMDRTNWKFGKTHINILTVGIVVGKVAVPLVWITLPQSTKRGNSHSRHRILIMKRVLQVLAVDDIDFLAIDREFNGTEWLEWMNAKGITWTLRVKKNTKINGVKAERFKSIKGKVKVWGMELYFGKKSIKNGRTSHLYVVSNTLPPKEALKAYSQRWAIEVLFGHLKKKGFDLESTHLRERRRIDKLIAVLALAFLFTIGWGIHLKESQAKLTARQKRKSVFRLALDLLVEMFTNPELNSCRINDFGKWITSQIKPQNFVV